MRVVAHRISATAFSSFGEVVEHTGSERRRMLSEATLPRREAFAARLWVSQFDQPASLPLTISALERHRFSPQTFLPLEVSRYLAIVAPSDPTGSPVLAQARAFVVGPGRGILYRQGTWHAGMTVLDTPARFAVLMWTTGEASLDDEFLALSTPLQITEA